MTEEQIENLVLMNMRLLLIMGYGSSAMIELSQYLSEEKKAGINWFLTAIENVVYLNKPLPPMPKGPFL